MIGSGLKKLAQKNAMKVTRGVGYGNLRGYAATLSEGSGYKQLVLTTKFPDQEKLQQLQDAVNGRNVTREFRVQKLSFAPNGVSVVFTDNPGTMKKIEAFFDWFFPLLEQSSATKADICTECGCQAIDGVWKLVDGVAFYMHAGCAEKLRRDISEEESTRREADTGSYLKGVLGAFGGAILGAIVWALVLSIGYVASVVGFIIGWLAEKGYNLLHGKQSKGKVVILILAVIVGVLLGTFLGECFSLAGSVISGEVTDVSYGDIPIWIALIFVLDSQYRAGVIVSALMGLLFAALGVYTLLRKTGKEVSGTKVIDLE